MKFGPKSLIAVLVLSACAFAQDAPSQLASPAFHDSTPALSQQSTTSNFGPRDKIGYYLVETYLNPSTFCSCVSREPSHGESAGKRSYAVPRGVEARCGSVWQELR